MTKLYTDLAQIYHEMYQGIFNYEKEFLFFHKILKNHRIQNIHELACGTGNLASYFLNHNYQYSGSDIAIEMIDIARSVCPSATFFQADMRHFNLESQVDGIIIPGRSFTYLIKNKDIQLALKSIHRNLTAQGILIFDHFDASKLITSKEKQFVQEFEINEKTFIRESSKKLYLQEGWTEEWNAIYIIKEKGKKTQKIKDKSIVRSFLVEEIKLFLSIHDFNTEEVISEGNIFTVVARKEDT